jgi:HSP20 family molecular chaperone IbpA
MERKRASVRQRLVKLPASANFTDVSAVAANGLLTVIVPKRPDMVSHRKIPITAA